MKKPQMVATILVMVALLLIGAACGSDEASPETAGLSSLGPEQVAPASGEARDEADDTSSEQVSSGMIIPRPNTIEDLVGQSHVIVPGTISSVVGEIRFGAYGEDGNPISAGEEPGTPYPDYEVRIESVLKGRSGVEDGGVLVLRMFGHLTLNPPKDTDGRREESGRGVRELQGK